jgi:hypothetical protein
LTDQWVALALQLAKLRLQQPPCADSKPT